MPGKVRIGSLDSLDDIRQGIRDLETALSELQEQAPVTLDDPPANAQVLVALADGTYEIWNLVSTGGCTITKNAGAKQLEISVP